MQLIDVSGIAALTAVEQVEVGIPWAVSLPVAPGRVLLYDPDTGAGHLVEVDGDGIDLGPELALPGDGTAVVVRP